jgi:hypothetical protein
MKEVGLGTLFNPCVTPSVAASEAAPEAETTGQTDGYQCPAAD